MSKSRGVWGKQPEQFYAELQYRPVAVKTLQGTFQGKLMGVGVYTVTIEQPSGLELLLHKGAIIYMHAAGETNNNAH